MNNILTTMTAKIQDSVSLSVTTFAKYNMRLLVSYLSGVYFLYFILNFDNSIFHYHPMRMYIAH